MLDVILYGRNLKKFYIKFCFTFCNLFLLTAYRYFQGVNY